MQIPVSIAFGYFIDLTMYMFFWVDPQNYVVKLISLLAGCVVLGFGVYMEVLADVVMLPGESFVRAIVQTWNTNFGTTKIIFDSSMTIMAGVLSVLFFGKLNGVREGTIMAALLVGFIARLFGKYLEFVKPYIFSEDYKTVEAQDAGNEKIQYKNIIVIGREWSTAKHSTGSGKQINIVQTIIDIIQEESGEPLRILILRSIAEKCIFFILFLEKSEIHRKIYQRGIELTAGFITSLMILHQISRVCCFEYCARIKCSKHNLYTKG